MRLRIARRCAAPANRLRSAQIHGSPTVFPSPSIRHRPLPLFRRMHDAKRVGGRDTRRIGHACRDRVK
jgi:hypothetical protein